MDGDGDPVVSVGVTMRLDDVDLLDLDRFQRQDPSAGDRPHLIRERNRVDELDPVESAARWVS